MCEAQQRSASLGYSPLPINLAQEGLDQIKKIPGVVVEDVDITKCKNPTFSPDGTNLLADRAPQPQACDQQGANQCPDGTGGAKKVKTAVKPTASGGQGQRGPTGTTASSGGAKVASASSSGGGATTPVTAADGSTVLAADNTASGSVGGSSNAADPVASPVVLTAPAGWSAAQSLIVLVGLFICALVIAPPLLWNRLVGDRRKTLS